MMVKTHTTVSVDPDLLQLAKEEGIILSKIFGDALRDAVGASENTNLKQFRLQRMAEIKSMELEEINNELNDISFRTKKMQTKIESDKEWDDNLIKKEEVFISTLTLEDFNSVSEWRNKILNKRLNKKFTYQNYILRFEKLIKK